jgi:hypothetical protein
MRGSILLAPRQNIDPTDIMGRDAHTAAEVALDPLGQGM